MNLRLILDKKSEIIKVTEDKLEEFVKERLQYCFSEFNEGFTQKKYLYMYIAACHLKFRS